VVRDDSSRRLERKIHKTKGRLSALKVARDSTAPNQWWELSDQLDDLLDELHNHLLKRELHADS